MGWSLQSEVLACTQQHCSYCGYKLLVWMLTSVSPAVLIYDFTYSAWVHRECWQPWAHWFMKDRADAKCPTVGMVKNRTRPTFHLGHTSCVYDCICMSLFYPFVYELSHCSQLWGWWSHINLAGGLWDSVGIPHFLLLLLLIEKHNLLGLGCENKNENTST